MAVYFLYMKTFGRGNGGSAPSAIAYRSGERIKDERTGRTYDHSGRQDVVHKEIVLPQKFNDSDMGWAKDRAALWNAAEAVEPRKNARVAREVLVALPAEMNDAQRLDLVRGFARDLVERYGFAIDFAIHAPRTDTPNHHAHLLATTRELGIEGFGEKSVLEISDARRQERGLEPFFKEVIAIRERWAAAANAGLAEANIDVRIDHRSLEAQGIEREPLPPLPRAVIELERRGERSFLGERLREEHRARVQERAARSAAPAAAESPRPVLHKDLNEIRRQARESWLEMRRRAELEACEPRARGHDDDLGR